jgi:excisionase family DNA binding protein
MSRAHDAHLSCLRYPGFDDTSTVESQALGTQPSQTPRSAASRSQGASPPRRFNPTSQSKEVLTVREAAELLDVDEQTIYRKLWSGDLPGDKSTGTWRLLRSELIEPLRNRSHDRGALGTQCHAPQGTRQPRIGRRLQPLVDSPGKGAR